MHDNDTIEDIAEDLRVAIAERDPQRPGSRRHLRAECDVPVLQVRLAFLVASAPVPTARDVLARAKQLV